MVNAPQATSESRESPLGGRPRQRRAGGYAGRHGTPTKAYSSTVLWLLSGSKEINANNNHSH